MADKRYFCTYFDRNYEARAQGMIQSMKRHAGDFVIYTLCMDDATFQDVTAWNDPAVLPVSIRDLEQFSPALLATRNTRNRTEYYFTCGPSFLDYLFQTVPEIDLLTYLDSDLYFFSSLDPLFEEMEGHSIAIIPHRFSRWAERFRPRGEFNVGWISFRRDRQGLACLQRWRDQCLEWCYDFADGGRYGDQKYLDEWPALYSRTRIIAHPGANVASWNVGRHAIAVHEGQVLVDGQPLIFFHFASFKEIRPWLYNTNFAGFGVIPGRTLRAHVFAPYIQAVRSIDTGTTRFRQPRVHDWRPGRWHLRAKAFLRTLRGALLREYIVYLNGRVY